MLLYHRVLCVGPQGLEHDVTVKLVWRARIIVRQRHISCCT